MSEPSTVISVSLSASGYEDGLGRRSLEIDRESGGMLERLHLRPELGAFEAFLRERVAFASVLDDERFARVRRIERDGRSGLTVVSDFVTGNRLCDLLEAATGLPADEASCPSVDAALGFLLEILPALESMHAIAGHAHGTIAPGRIVLTPASQVVILDWLFGPMIERLQFNRRKLWSDFEIVAPPAAGPTRLDVAGDLAQVSLTAMMIVLGRPLRQHDYPEDIATLLGEVIEIAQIRGSEPFAAGLHAYLQRTLPLPGRRPHARAEEAAAEVRQVASEIGISRCRAALTAFMEDMNRVLARELEEHDALPNVSAAGFESAIDDFTAALAFGDAPIENSPIEPISAVESEIDAYTASAYPAGDEISSTPDVYDEPARAAIDIPDADSATLAIDSGYSADVTAAPAENRFESSAPEFEEPVAIPEPIAFVEPEPIPVSVSAPIPEPVIAPVPTPIEPEPPVFVAVAPEPVTVKSVEPEPVAPLPPPPPAPSAKTKDSKRKKRGSKGHRDKLHSNAAPPKPAPAPPPPPPQSPAIRMPVFNQGPEPLRQEAPAAPAIAFRQAPGIKPAAPLRLKTEPAPSYAAPPRIERREAPEIHSLWFGQRESDGGSAFPWKLAAAAVVVVVILVGVGRAYLPSRQDDAAETTETSSAVAPAASTKSEPGKAGSVSITTQPAGAHVLLDGKSVGDSPLTVDAVSAGKHTLTFVTSSGTVKKSIRVESGKPLAIDIPIYSGWIAVFSPISLDIAENGRGIGTTEQGRLMLSPGRHQLTFSNRDMGYKTTQAVDIEPGEERSISIAPMGELNANATPWAEVWMNGNKIGDTPLAAVRVPLGTHEVLFKNPRYPEKHVTVTVTAKGAVTAAVDFMK